jgi:hypothetical protein
LSTPIGGDVYRQGHNQGGGLVFIGAWSLLCHYWSAEFASLFSPLEKAISEFRKCHEKELIIDGKEEYYVKQILIFSISYSS